MSTNFSHPGLGVIEILAALAIGFWIGARYTSLLPEVLQFVQSLLNT
jgi:hypothetical protein